MRLFVDNFTNLDFSYLCPQRGLLGETWLASIELEGRLDDQGMICDFGTVKKICRAWLDEMIDHRLLCPIAHPASTLTTTGSNETITFSSQTGLITCSAPPQSLTAIPTETITKTSVADWCIDQLRGKFADSVEGIKLTFTEEVIDGPFYHYSHGLKKHLGNCQRIAHGHRSKIQIWRNGEPAPDLMADWAARWKDIYIGTQSDLKHRDPTHHHFAYRAQQGEFELSVPSSQTYLIDSDSTVEWLAQHIATTLASETGDCIVVKAFEGLAKGAIATVG